MNYVKQNLLKLTMAGLGLFVVGLIVGFFINNGENYSLRGYILDAQKSSSTATTSNASDSNASDANASDANASDANASDANVSINDNIMYLDSFSLVSNSIVSGGKVNINIKTSGACNSGASIVFKNNEIGASFTATVQDLSNNPYIVVPKDAVSTTYTVTDILLTGTNSDQSTFTLHCEENMFECTSINNNQLTVTVPENKNSVQTLSLTDIKVASPVEAGNKTNVTVISSEELTDAKLVFTNAANESFSASVGPFGCKCETTITVPSTAKAGIYTLTKATIKSKNGSAIYSKTAEEGTQALVANITLEVKESSSKSYVYDNSSIDSTIISEIYKAPEKAKITINADDNTIIKEEVFTAIKGKDKDLIINYKDNQLIFNGKDIVDSKTIDVTLETEVISKDSDIIKLVPEGLIVKFADNGDLPGKAVIKLKETEELKDTIKDNSYIYFYNEDSKNFCEVDSKVTKKDGYYEFTITHNSRYVIVNEKLDSSLVVLDANEVGFTRSPKEYLIMIVAGLVIIVGSICLIVFLKKKNSKVSKRNIITETNMNNENKEQ